MKQIILEFFTVIGEISIVIAKAIYYVTCAILDALPEGKDQGEGFGEWGGGEDQGGGEE